MALASVAVASVTVALYFIQDIFGALPPIPPNSAHHAKRNSQEHCAVHGLVNSYLEVRRKTEWATPVSQRRQRRGRRRGGEGRGL